MPRVNTAGRQINWALMQKDFLYLEEITVPNVRPEQVTVIIGAYFKRAHDKLEIQRCEKDSHSQAELTSFGWLMFGKVSNRYRLNPSKRQRSENAVRWHAVDEELKRHLERLWTTETFGIKAQGVKLPVPAEERRARIIIETTTRQERYPSYDDRTTSPSLTTEKPPWSGFMALRDNCPVKRSTRTCTFRRWNNSST